MFKFIYMLESEFLSDGLFPSVKPSVALISTIMYGSRYQLACNIIKHCMSLYLLY